jgi:regulator of replication initiation timing
MDSEGNRTPAADGDYKTDDNKVIVVVEGKVSEIKDAEAEVAPAEGEESEFIETDKGKLEWDNEEEDLKEGDAVYVRDVEGNRVPAPDGDYTTEDGKVIKVADGKVTEIVDDRAEVAPEMEEENPADEPDTRDERIRELEERIRDLEAENDALRAENDALKGEMTKLKKTPAAKPAHEVVKEEQKMSKTGNKGLDRLSRIMSAK